FTRIRGLEALIAVDGETACPIRWVIRHTTDGARTDRRGESKFATRCCLFDDVRARSSINQISIPDAALKTAIHHHPAAVAVDVVDAYIRNRDKICTLISRHKNMPRAADEEPRRINVVQLDRCCE